MISLYFASQRIANPLHGVSRDGLLRNVTAFVEEYGFTEHLKTFQKGALVAQNPNEFETLDVLDDVSTSSHTGVHS